MSRTRHVGRASRTTLRVTLLITLLGSGCEGRLGIEAASEGPPRLRPPETRLDSDAGARDAAAPSVDAALAPALDAWMPPHQPDAAMAPGCGTATEQAVIAHANEARGSAGLGPLACDSLMTTVARAHSEDMCARGYFSHTALDGRSPFDRMRDAGVRFGAAGENIAQGQRGADEVHTAWMNSAGHRMNILGAAYGRVGVGLAECGGRMYWTQVFAD